MSDGLSIQGTLSETTVPSLFRTMIRSGETGALSVAAAHRHDSIYFSRGKVVSATTTDADLGLAEVLLRSGDLDIRQYQLAHDRVVPSRRIGSVLLELGFLGTEGLLNSEESRVSNIVMDVLSYRSGDYTIDFADEFPQEVVALSIDTERLVLSGVQRINHWSLIRRGIGRMTRLLRQSTGADARIYGLELQEEESHIYSLVAEPQKVQSICDRSYLSNFKTCRTLLALMTVNLIDEGETSDVDDQRASAQSELEIESLVERYNVAFQTLFAIVFQEVGDHTWDFMDRVVRHVSPETMPYLSGISMTNEGRIDFDQLFNNLISSGTLDHADVVNSILNEILVGWIVETRDEFGERLEAAVAQVVEPLKKP